MASDRRIMVLSPRYGPVIDEAREAALNPTRGAFSHHFATIAQTSMTSNCFNSALASALNQRDALGITHIGMVHADVAVQPGWADVYLDLMETYGLSLVSGVVAIKNDEGKTSTAIGSRSDPWAIKDWVRVGGHEKYGMTFTTKDVAESPDDFLMVNTAVWLADFRLPFWESFGGFRFHTDVVKGPDGTWTNRMRPEDWEMSRDLDEAGIPYGATFQLRIAHEGPRFYWNREPVRKAAPAEPVGA